MNVSRSYLEERRSARRWQAITGIVAACALAAAALWALEHEADAPDSGVLLGVPAATPIAAPARDGTRTAMR